MAPAFGAHHPSANRVPPQHDLNARSKQIDSSAHDGREAAPAGDLSDQGRQESHESREITPRLASRPSPAPTSPVRYPKSSVAHRRRASSITSAASASTAAANSTPSRSTTTAIDISDAVQPQLSERDSIFATHYFPSPSSPVTPNIRSKASRSAEGRSVDDFQTKHPPSDDKGKRDPEMAVSPLRSNPMDFHHSPALRRDFAPSPLPRHHTTSTTSPPHNTYSPRPSRTSLPSHYHRRSLYDLHDFGSLPFANLLQTVSLQDPSLPDTPLRRDHSPATPSPGLEVVDYVQDLDTSAERQQYRSWRKGQAKIDGMTIKESQRKASKGDISMDRVIDAQMPPQPEAATNTRSRKASHYLGLFRENEAEERRDNEKKKSGKERESESQLSKDIKAHTTEPTIAEDVEAVEDGDEVTVSKDHMARKLPLGLLEEIRNYAHLAPRSGQKIQYRDNAPSRDPERRAHDQGRDSAKSDDEYGPEHIASATYYPHAGTLADSPTEEQPIDRKLEQETEKKAAPDRPQGNDVQVSLEWDGSRDYLQGMSRPASDTQLKDESSATFSDLPPPELESEYETDGAYVTEDDETEVVTPTATPRIRAQDEEDRSAPAPVGAVELKPYKHQVGGHTPVYRFSRRAVCKQLNSKENKFYETVERSHPELLGFMPRYIGVLNVTYRKEQRKRKPTVSDDTKPQEQTDAMSEHAGASAGEKRQDAGETRIISHSMQTPGAIPQVIFANNRHLIPDSLFGGPARSVTPDLERTRCSLPIRENHSDDETSNGATPLPSLVPAQSWGFTTRNSQLRDRVLREVFAPPVIHKSDRRERAYHSRTLRKIPKHLQDDMAPQRRQNSVDVSSLQRYQPSATTQNSPISKRSRLQASQSEINEALPNSDIERLLRDKSVLSRSAETGTDAGLKVPPGRPHHRRRHSGGGLTRKATDIEGNRGDLEFHENEDEAYGADAEDDVFAMDDVKKDKPVKHRKSSSVSSGLETSPQATTSGIELVSPDVLAENKLVPRLEPAIDFSTLEPRNPETSLVQHDERVERFLLLEDLTSGMQKPCVLDLKMGTRQYGVEATKKKQDSQRMKCKTTTSRRLGVRVCGMQVFNVKKQKYDFEDKYFGRDLTAGTEFEEALKRFFFDGIGHAQALKHIPSVLDKINHLDGIIRNLPGYRLYASSLLMIYDRGDADENGKVKPEKDEHGRPAQYGDIKLKIVDFANCVTAEDRERVMRKPCPPAHPDAIDKGYLRGLRSLKAYFQKIYQELLSQRFVERGEGEGMAIDQRGISSATTHKGWTDSVIDDPGEVSL